MPLDRESPAVRQSVGLPVPGSLDCLGRCCCHVVTHDAQFLSRPQRFDVGLSGTFKIKEPIKGLRNGVSRSLKYRAET